MNTFWYCLNFLLCRSYGDVIACDFSKSPWRQDLKFDCIITDPPYGIRKAEANHLLYIYFFFLRYMMYIDGSNQYFIDRDNAIFQIEGLTFYSDVSFKRLLVDTLVDGEMVIDKDPEGNQHPRYLIYDLISLEGNQISQESFSNRMRTIQVLKKILKY